MSQQAQKILAVVLLAILLVAIPLTLKFGVGQQQNVEQKANTELYKGGLDSCGHVKVSQITETPSACANGGKPDLTSYTTTAYIVSADGGTYQNVSVKWYGFWCKTASELGGDPTNKYACLKNEQDNASSITVSKTAQSFAVTVNPVESGVNYGACGRYQTDFVLSYTFNGKKCTFGTSPFDFSTTANVLGYGYCWARVADCVAPSVTPTSTPTPGPTATPTPGPTATPTPGPTATPTPTPENTPTPGPTDTPTPGPTSTPGPTATPRPTLPPTGPGETIVGIGLVGVAAAVIGAALFLAL